VRDAAGVAREICGAQAQEPRAGRLAFRARSARLSAAAVDRARTEERSIVRTWAMRRTMHLIATEDFGWLVPLFERETSENSRRRLTQLGMESRVRERGLREIGRALAGGPLDRSALSERLARRGVELTTQTRMHLFRLAVTSGVAVLGPDAAGGQTALVLEREWLGERPPHDREAALAELARRYLRAFGPATEADFAGWAGLPLRDVRAGLRAIAAELGEVALPGGPALKLRGAARRARGRIVRLLPAWDTYLMGHRDRSHLAGPEEWRRVMPGGGILKPAIVIDGMIAGTWRSERRRGEVEVELEPFAELGPEATAALAAERADVARFEA
jgi:Winged helix DNA-binding domain